MEKYEAQKKYHAIHRKEVKLAFMIPSEQEVYNFIQTKQNKAGYIKNLIKEDMKKATE